MPPVFLDVDPRELRAPSLGGADPFKLQRQIARYGASSSGMPPIAVYEHSDGTLVVFDGLTRATRIAKLSPGKLVRVEVIGRVQRPGALFPRIGDLLP